MVPAAPLQINPHGPLNGSGTPAAMSAAGVGVPEAARRGAPPGATAEPTTPLV